MIFRRSAQISCSGAGASPLRRSLPPPWRAPRAREGGPAPIREVSADLRQLMLASLSAPRCLALRSWCPNKDSPLCQCAAPSAAAAALRPPLPQRAGRPRAGRARRGARGAAAAFL
ncbi:unnamed protein product [Prorocentrum cordatum]|uniref:Uncharacterized protein n=1 Tax=Prorocentrum cordatum TaxID=2364126 RepID=A0ABN9RLW1_9DINO|nr:unnamed protein product [Polarella glacialis]